jgi:hypothetical protein
MKVFQEGNILNAGYADQVQKSEKPDVGKFDTILKETMDNTSKAESGTSRTEAIVTMAKIPMGPLSPKTAEQVIGQTEKFLDKMNGYMEKLSNPRVSLKEIYPLVQAMEAEKEHVTPIINALPEGDGLKDILNEVLITSSKEVIKFYRGDYIDH